MEKTKKPDEKGFITILQEDPSLRRKYRQLAEFLPEIQEWCPSIAKRQLIFHIHHDLKIDLGVCDYYLVDDDQQFCIIDNNTCSCKIPQGFCILRDLDLKPKYPEFTPCLNLLERRCPNCDHWVVCMKSQLDYDTKRKYNETNGIPRTPEYFWRFMAERCEHFRI